MVRDFSVGEVVKRSGQPVSTLHFYERNGLISSYRTTGRQRRYHGDVIRRLSIIRFAQDLGISLAEIKDVLGNLPTERIPDRDDWKRLEINWKRLLDRRVQLLQRLGNSLASCIGCGCLSLDQCAIYNSNDKLSIEGPGPRILLRENVQTLSPGNGT